jgi:hypothetical protein
MDQSSFTPTRIVGIAIAVLAIFAIPYFVSNMWENLDAHEIMVVQSPVDGTLTVYTDPGVKYQGFGKVTRYPRRAQYTFENHGKDDTNAKKIRFNDGGHALLSGAVSWEMPLKPEAIINIHKTFGSAEGVQDAAVAKMIDSAVYLAGPLMSSTESSGERRSELLNAISDQAEHGVYVTRVVEKEVKDGGGGVGKTVTVTEIVRDKDGNPKRQQGSILQEFNIKLLPLAIKELRYDKIVEDQIAQQQKAKTEVSIAQANSKKAQQDAMTAEEQGKAQAAKAKWDQEKIKAQVVTEAQQKLEVATLAAKEAEQFKREQILRGEGEAARKTLVMNADGALDVKVEAYKEVQKYWADAFAKSSQPLVPQFQMGANANGSANSVNAAQNLVELMTIKTAKDLATDMTVSGKSQTAKK